MTRPWTKDSRSKNPALDQVKEIVADLEALKKKADEYGITLEGDRMGYNFSWVKVMALIDGIEAKKIVTIKSSDTF